MTDARLRSLSLLSLALMLPLGCDRKEAPPAQPPTTAASPAKEVDHGHEHGVTVQLGEQREGDYVIKASRDGELKPDADAPIDVWVSGGKSRVVAVRFWIGAADAKGSIKAKAEIEGDHWHTHAETPATIGPDARLWVEVEAEGGVKTLTSFDLRR
ncbi:MAG: hypothetical protein WCK33_08750 [Phycisphaerae bacterium]|jgi:hypothetical protein